MIQEERFDGEPVFRLENDRIVVWIAPSVGANVYRLHLKGSDEEILRSPKTFLELKKHPVYYGMPVLVPPNRIRNAHFAFQGKTFELPVNTPEGHHIHGLSLDRPWRFSTLDDSSEATSITFSFDVVDHNDLYLTFPFSLKFEYTVRIVDNSIETELRVVNLDKIAIPIGAGFHTWFHLLGGTKRWHLQLPFEKVWELDEESFPTGNLIKGDQVDLLRSGISLGDKNFDTIFLRGHNAPEATLVRDDGFSITYTMSEEFKHWVLHTTPEANDCIAIEPYSWITDAPNLQLPPSLSGLLIVGPSEEQHFHGRIQLG